MCGSGKEPMIFLWDEDTRSTTTVLWPRNRWWSTSCWRIRWRYLGGQSRLMDKRTIHHSFCCTEQKRLTQESVEIKFWAKKRDKKTKAYTLSSLSVDTISCVLSNFVSRRHTTATMQSAPTPEKLHDVAVAMSSEVRLPRISAFQWCVCSTCFVEKFTEKETEDIQRRCRYETRTAEVTIRNDCAIDLDSYRIRSSPQRHVRWTVPLLSMAHLGVAKLSKKAQVVLVNGRDVHRPYEASPVRRLFHTL